MSTCPACNNEILKTIAADDSGVQPLPGDVIVCGHCGSYLMFDDSMETQIMTVDEICDLESDILSEMSSIRADILNHNR